jgi:hypothetical protein
MDAYDHLDLDEIDFAPVEHTTKRLTLLPLEEAHDLLRLLVAVAQAGGLMSREAARLAGVRSSGHCTPTTRTSSDALARGRAGKNGVAPRTGPPAQAPPLWV